MPGGIIVFGLCCYILNSNLPFVRKMGVYSWKLFRVYLSSYHF